MPAFIEGQCRYAARKQILNQRGKGVPVRRVLMGEHRQRKCLSCCPVRIAQLALEQQAIGRPD